MSSPKWSSRNSLVSCMVSTRKSVQRCYGHPEAGGHGARRQSRGRVREVDAVATEGLGSRESVNLERARLHTGGSLAGRKIDAHASSRSSTLQVENTIRSARNTASANPSQRLDPKALWHSTVFGANLHSEKTGLSCQGRLPRE